MKITDYYFCFMLFVSFLSFLVSTQHLRIINGDEVEPPYKYSFMVSIRKGGGPYCGGVMLSKNVLITAAHCSKSGKLQDFKVLLHRHNLKLSSEEEGGQTLKVQKRIPHPQYDSNSSLILVAVSTLR